MNAKIAIDVSHFFGVGAKKVHNAHFWLRPLLEGLVCFGRKSQDLACKGGFERAIVGIDIGMGIGCLGS